MPSFKHEVELGGRKQQVTTSWYRGEHCNYNPQRANLRSRGAVEQFILPGWLPEAPFITPDTKVTAFGSCFAENIANYLNERNYDILTKSDANAYVVSMSEGLVNSFAIRGQFDWAFRGIKPKAPELWHGYRAEKFGYDEEVRLMTRALFDDTDVFILTLGLSEIWYDTSTGEAFWRAVPVGYFDASRHTFRVSTVTENAANLRAIYEMIREFRPSARIVVTLSPIPLVATFRPVSSITANSVSKAILRAAIDEVVREAGDPEHLLYWPSYEIVQDAFGTGKWWPDGRHVAQPVLDYIMALFETYYCLGSVPEHTLTELQVLAMEAAGDLPPEPLQAIRAGDRSAFSRWADQQVANDDPETAELLSAYAAELSASAPLPR